MIDTINRAPQRELNGKDLIWLVNEYLKESTNRINANTLTNYTYVLNYFVQWWGQVGPAQDWIVRRTSFQEYLRWLEKQPSHQGETIGFNTVDTSMRRLRQVFKWAYTEEFFARDYSRWIPRPSGQQPYREAPDPECLERLFLAANESVKPIRNKALLAVMIGTGIRRTECVSIDIEHIQVHTDKPGGKILIPKGKGSKPRLVVFDDTAKHYISLLLAHQASIGIESGALFIGKTKRMVPKSLNGVIRVLIRKAGLVGIVQGPHDLRRMFATYWSRKQRGEGFTQPLSLQLGHTDRAMTLLYSKQDLSDVEEVFTSPLEALDGKRV